MRILELFESGDNVLKLSGGMKTIPIEVPSENVEPMVIKLGSKRTSTAAQRFMFDYEHVTKEHPFTRDMRYFEDGPVLVKMGEDIDDSETVELRDIQSKARGAGARALKTICEIADARDVAINLYAKGYDRVPTSKLVEYYERFGFYRLDHLPVDDGEYGEGIEMSRDPR